MRILLLLLITIKLTAQEIPIVQHSSFCEGINALGGFGVYKERIKESGRTDMGHYLISSVIVRRCGQPIFPVSAIKYGDTLRLTTTQISAANYQLDNDEQISRVYNGEECECAYEFRFEVPLDTVLFLTIDGAVLSKGSEKYLTYPLRYFIFKGDTTGYEDEYGRRQGSVIIQRKNDLLKSLYKDGTQVSCELLTLDGKLIRREKDCYPFIEKSQR